jgi:hypothetical protein
VASERAPRATRFCACPHSSKQNVSLSPATMMKMRCLSSYDLTQDGCYIYSVSGISDL